MTKMRAWEFHFKYENGRFSNFFKGVLLQFKSWFVNHNSLRAVIFQLQKRIFIEIAARNEKWHFFRG